MSDLIHKIVGKIIEVGQSDTMKFRLGETIRYSPSEILEILKQHESEIFGEGSSTQTNAFNALNALDTISRQAAIDEIEERINAHSLGCNVALISELNRVEGYILHLPFVQHKPLKYTGESICLYCQTADCEGCMYEPVEGVQLCK